MDAFLLQLLAQWGLTEALQATTGLMKPRDAERVARRTATLLKEDLSSAGPNDPMLVDQVLGALTELMRARQMLAGAEGAALGIADDEGQVRQLLIEQLRPLVSEYVFEDASGIVVTGEHALRRCGISLDGLADRVLLAARTAVDDVAAQKEGLPGELKQARYRQLRKDLSRVTAALSEVDAGVDRIEQSVQDIKNSRPMTDTQTATGLLVQGSMPHRAPALRERSVLLERLCAAGEFAVPGVCTIIGARGMGKSQLAAAYARSRVAQGWPVAWVTAESEEQLIAGYVELGDRLGRSEQDHDDARAVAGRVLQWLTARSEPCLVVLDNALDPAVVKTWTSPGVGSTHFVVTSTRRAVARLGFSIEVGPFSPDEAHAFLVERLGSTDLDSSTGELISELDGHPLGLALAAGVLESGLAYGEYLDQLRALPIDVALDDGEGDPYGRGVTVAIELSLSAAMERHSGARAILELLSVMAPSGMDRSLLAQEDASNRARLEEILRVLFDTSLLMVSEDRRTVLVHRLIARVIREFAIRDGRIHRALAVVAMVVSKQLAESKGAWDKRYQVAELISHTEALLDHSCTGEGALLENVHTSIHSHIASLAMLAASHLNEIHSPNHALAFAEAAVRRHLSLSGHIHPSTLESQQTLAYAYLSLGQINEAINLYQAVVLGRERTLGTDHPETLTARNHLGHAYQTAGQIGEAIRLYRQVLADRERVLGYDAPLTWNSRHSLAHAYELAGQVDEAIDLYRLVLSASTTDDPDTLATQHNLACSYMAARQLEDAINLFRQTATDRSRILGADHPDTLLTRERLAQAYEMEGRLNEALDLLLDVATDRERVLGGRHPETLSSWNSLAAIYRSAGQVDEAIQLYRKVVSDSTEVMGNDHLNAMTARQNLAHALLSAGQADEALALLQQLTTDRDRVLQPDHPLMLSTLQSLGVAYASTGRVDEAIDLLRRILTDQESLFGMGPDASETRLNLAQALLLAGQSDEGITLLQHALVDHDQIYGSNHPLTLKVQDTLASSYRDAGRLNEAIELLRSMVVERERAAGSEDPALVVIRHNLASTYELAGRLGDAREMYEKSLDIARNVLPLEHPVIDRLRRSIERLSRDPTSPSTESY